MACGVIQVSAGLARKSGLIILFDFAIILFVFKDTTAKKIL